MILKRELPEGIEKAFLDGDMPPEVYADYLEDAGEADAANLMRNYADAMKEKSMREFTHFLLRLDDRIVKTLAGPIPNSNH